MSTFQLVAYDDPRVLVEQADAWNDLWRRSEVAAPSARAEHVANWIAAFAADEPFHAITVRDGERLVAALPLIGGRMKHLVRVGMLPQNEWTSGGDLLVDAAADVPRVLDCLCQGVATLPWSLLWLEELPLAAPRWRALEQALVRANMPYETTVHSSTAQVELNHDWERYEATRDGNHRRSRHRYARKLERTGVVRFEVHAPADPAEVDRLCRAAFEIEDRSWKGAAGTSVIEAGLLDYFQAQARLLAAENQLEFAFLTLDDRPMAFAYCWRSKGIAFIAKLGYDDAFRQFGPGQQLVMHVLERLNADPECCLLDFWGRLAPWNESWATRTYDVGRLVAAPPRMLSRGLLRAYASLCELKPPPVEPTPPPVVTVDE